MKKVSLFALAVSTAVGSMASAQPVAAPVAVPAPVAAPCPCPKAFQGFHLGGNVGYGIGSARVTHSAPTLPLATSTDLGVKGFDGGLNVGYTHRFGNWGLGLEGVFTWSSTKGRNNISIGGNTFNEQARLKNSIQLRGNISYIICNLVAPKVILGWDNSQWERRVSLLGDTVRNKKRYNGFLWGAGVDFLLAKHVIAGLEYTGVIAGKKSFGFDEDTTSFRPQYNKFALVVKFIY